MSVHWNTHLDRWLAVYLSFGKIVARTATALEGPWSHESTLFVPHGHGAIHALAHQEYQEEQGATEYVSYLGDEFRLLRIRLEKP
jgi:hypothetical protein